MIINGSYNNYSSIECLPGSMPPTGSLYTVRNFSYFLFLHVYVIWSVCMCAFMFIYLCAHKCGFLYIKGRGWWFLQLISALFTNTRTLSEPRASLTSTFAIGTLCLCLPSLGIQVGCHTHPIFYWWALGS